VNRGRIREDKDRPQPGKVSAGSFVSFPSSSCKFVSALDANALVPKVAAVAEGAESWKYGRESVSGILQRADGSALFGLH